MRGVSGAGKSSVSKLFGSKAICSADDYFMHNGEYKWYGEGLGKAHAWCKRKCEQYMKIGAELIIIDNTSTRAKEFKTYVDMAKKYNYIAHSLIVENRHNGINTHGVPEEIIEAMRKRFEIQL